MGCVPKLFDRLRGYVLRGDWWIATRTHIATRARGEAELYRLVIPTALVCRCFSNAEMADKFKHSREFVALIDAVRQLFSLCFETTQHCSVCVNQLTR